MITVRLIKFYSINSRLCCFYNTVSAVFHVSFGQAAYVRSTCTHTGVGVLRHAHMGTKVRPRTYALSLMCGNAREIYTRCSFCTASLGRRSHICMFIKTFAAFDIKTLIALTFPMLSSRRNYGYIFKYLPNS